MKLYQHFKGGLYIVMSEDTLDASVDTYDAISKTDDGADSLGDLLRLRATSLVLAYL